MKEFYKKNSALSNHSDWFSGACTTCICKKKEDKLQRKARYYVVLLGS